MLNDTTEEGFVFRVDLDLRPEGTKGEITNSIGAMEIYYESWGRQWERQALIKARYCGGSRQVAEETLERLHPFVYRKYLDQKAIDEIASIKVRIDQSLVAQKGPKRAGRDIKLGRGGIREIEFIVQALQLLYGARTPELQVKSTLETLDVCDSLGLLSTPHYRDLKEAYIFYRRIENRIQYYHGTQTHLVPENEEMQKLLAKQMGVACEGEGFTLLDEVKRRRERVRKIFDSFFTKSEEKTDETFPVPLDDEKAVADWLDSLRFNQPEMSARALNFLRNGRPFTHPSENSRTIFDRFGPLIVAEAVTTPWPDHVLLGFDALVEARHGRDMLYDLLDKHRPVIKLLSAIFSSSEHLTNILLRHPDILDRMLVFDLVDMPPDTALYRRELESSFEAGGALEDQITRVNSFRIAEMLRLGIRGILGLADRFETMGGLTALAEEYLKVLSKIACGSVDISSGFCDDVRWTLLAAGKLGRREMNFGSDIDLLIFYEGGDCAGDYVTKLAQTIIRLSGIMTPYGAGYQIDMRLRPEGEMGPLTVSYKAMESYYNSRGVAWERLALVGARPISGDEVFSEKVQSVIRRFIFSAPLTAIEAKKIMDIRERIADEKVKPGAVDIKFGRGGMIEIEFICQWLRLERPLSDGERVDERPFTITTLKEAKERAWLEPGVADQLIDGYMLFRSIEDALRMDREQAVNQLPLSGLALYRVARRLNIPGAGPDRFVGYVKGVMKNIRRLYLEFGGARA
ncbi:Glutamate-ammonia-ligase adenylyltransferase [hydrothermal vent metagenome]|uniref:Glutamate-ammonia-ligase adenylyltransferase n=1 Tax=hydrothermal vent metagenome TaxID=652676 RepID=A0A3B1C624_9ZZZZ